MAPDYWVQATKKGGLPLSTEKRKYGKPVTIIQNCGGDVEALLTALKSALGTGGCAYGGTGLEIQGSLVDKIGSWLIRAGCVRGLAKQAAPADAAAACGGSSADGDGSLLHAAREKHETRSKPRWSAEKAAAVAAKATGCAAFGTPPLGGEHDPYRAFCALMRSWCYWDQDWNRLPELWELQGAEEGVDDKSGLGDGSRAGGGMDERVGVQGGRAGAVSGAGSGAGGLKRTLDDALRELGMVADPCPTRQKRSERLAVAARSRYDLCRLIIRIYIVDLESVYIVPTCVYIYTYIYIYIYVYMYIYILMNVYIYVYIYIFIYIYMY